MIDEGALELRSLIVRVETAAAELGLMDAEVAAILNREVNGWPMTIVEHWVPMEQSQETRLRDLYEVCRSLDRVFGPDAPMWLRRSGRSVAMTPLAFLMFENGALRALRDVLRQEMASG